MEKNQGKLIVGLFLATVFSAISQASFADMGLNQQVLDKVDGKYGANLNSVTGATIDTNGNYANIKNTQTNSVLNWNSLNTAPGQTLNYVMTSGQTSLNKVVTPQLSSFAGNLTSTGGRVIISNPMGIIFENGSYTNVNALTLTTHDAQIVDGKLILKSANIIESQGIRIGGVGESSKAAVMRVADDLNIVSNNIRIDNADIFVNNANLVTSDGITFVDKEMTITDSTNANATMLKDSNNEDIGTIHVKDSIITVKDEQTGRIFIASKGDVAGVKVEKSVVEGKVQLDVDGNANMSVIGNADIVDSVVTNNLNVETVNDTITLDNSNSYYDLTNYVYTLHDYLTAKFGPSYTKSNTKKYLMALAKDKNSSIKNMANSVVNYYYDNAPTTVCGEMKVAYDYSTHTSFTGNGNVSVSNTVVGKDLTAQGATVTLADIVAYQYAANAVGTNGVSSLKVEKLNKTNETQRYSFDGTYDSLNRMLTGNFDTKEPLIKNKTVYIDKNEYMEKLGAIDAGNVNISNVITTKPIVTPDNNNATIDNADASNEYGSDHDKRLYGDEVNARFTRQFSPRGFAANDDEIKARKAKVKSTARSGNNNSIILNDNFIAE